MWRADSARRGTKHSLYAAGLKNAYNTFDDQSGPKFVNLPWLTSNPCWNVDK